MKKIVMTALLVMAAGSMLFAQGTQEQNGAQNYGQRFISDEVSVTGIFGDTGNEVVLTTDEGTYSLSATHLQMVDFSDYNGATVTVAGTLADESLCPEGYDGHIFVETAEVNGEEYSFDAAGRWNDDNDFYGARGGNNMMNNSRGNQNWDNDAQYGNRRPSRSNNRGMTSGAGYQNWDDCEFYYRGAQGSMQNTGRGRVF